MLGGCLVMRQKMNTAGCKIEIINNLNNNENIYNINKRINLNNVEIFIERIYVGADQTIIKYEAFDNMDHSLIINIAALESESYLLRSSTIDCQFEPFSAKTISFVSLPHNYKDFSFVIFSFNIMDQNFTSLFSTSNTEKYFIVNKNEGDILNYDEKETEKTLLLEMSKSFSLMFKGAVPVNISIPLV